jgi:hypothetical protein
LKKIYDQDYLDLHNLDLDNLDLDDAVIVGKLIYVFKSLLFCDTDYRQSIELILKDSLKLRQIVFQTLTLDGGRYSLFSLSREPYLCIYIPFVKHLAQETDIGLKQEIFNYVEHQIDNHQPLKNPAMLMWYEFSQAFASLQEDPIISSRSTRLYDYTYAKWEDDYKLVLEDFHHGYNQTYRHEHDFFPYLLELEICGDERSLPIMKIMVEHNEIHSDDYDDNGAGGLPHLVNQYYRAEDILNVILQRVNNRSHHG